MLSILVFLCVISSGSIFGIAVFHKRFSDLLPITCITCVAVLFLCGLVNCLPVGVYALLVIAAGLIGYSIWYLIHQHAGKRFFRELLTADFLIFVIGCVLVLIGTLGMEADTWDDFSHWADTVKNMTLVDALSTTTPDNVIFASYPPGMSLFQYLLQKIHILLHPGAGFQEWYVFFANKVFVLAVLAPLFRRIRWKRPLAILFAILTSLLVPQILSYHYYTSAMIDPFLGILCGMGMACLVLYREEPVMKLLSVTATSFMLVMAKDVGLMFAIMLAICMGLDQLLLQKGRPALRRLLYTAVPVAALMVPKVVWILHMEAWGVYRYFHHQIILKDLVNVILQRDTTWKQESWNGFLPKLFQETTLISYFDWKAPLIVCLAVLLALMAGLWLLIRKRAREVAGASLLVCICSALQTVFYIVGLAVMYLFNFDESLGLHYASFERYIKVVLLGMLIVVLCLWFVVLERSRRLSCVLEIGSLVLLLLVSPLESAWRFVSRKDVEIARQNRAPYDWLSAQMLSQSTEGKAWYICQQDDGTDYYPFKYCVKPIQLEKWGWTLGDAPRYYLDRYEDNLTPEEWMEALLDGYDYVILQYLDEYFLNTYADLFENPEEITEGSIFRIDKTNRRLEKCS